MGVWGWGLKVGGGGGGGCRTAGGRRGFAFFFFLEDGKSWGEEGGREGSHLPSIFTGSELLNWELELERVPETLQIQLHLEREEDGGGGERRNM